MEYKLGDLVCHKTKPNADVKMIICYIEEENSSSEPRYWCRWFDTHNHICEYSFKNYELELLNL